MNKATQKGFSLIELSVVIVIIGLMVSAILPYIKVEEAKKKQEYTKTEMTEAARMLGKFVGAYDGPDADTAPDSRMPCPAALDAAAGTPEFGVEQCPALNAANGSMFNGVRVAVAANGTRVFIGGIPTRTMETLGDLAFDPYFNKYLYAVSANLTVAGSVTSETVTGSITVEDETGVVSTTKPFVLVSTGRNGMAATATNGDAKNIDNDTVFLTRTGHSEAPGNSFYDDRILFGFSEDVGAVRCKAGYDEARIQDFTASGIWTKPANAAMVVIEGMGASGGGGAAETFNMGKDGGCAFSCSGGNGGKGGYGIKHMSASTLPAAVAVTIGTGGTGGTQLNTTGGTGTNTSFGTSMTLTSGTGGTKCQSPSRGYRGLANGTNGRATGADSTSSVYGFGGSASGGGGGSASGCFAKGNGAAGSSGFLRVTTYICN